LHNIHSFIFFFIHLFIYKAQLKQCDVDQCVVQTHKDNND